MSCFFLGVCRIADVVDVVETREGESSSGAEAAHWGVGALISSLLQCCRCCGANLCSKYLCAAKFFGHRRPVMEAFTLLRVPSADRSSPARRAADARSNRPRGRSSRVAQGCY